MTEVMVTADGFVVDAELVGAAFGIDAASVPARMRTGELTSRCETGIDQDAGRFRLTLFSGGRALRLTINGEGNVLARSTFSHTGSTPAGVTTDNEVVSMDLTTLGERLVREMPDALVVADAQGLIRFWNAGAERIFGFASDEALGRSLDLITPENLRARHWSGFRRTMETGETRYGTGDLLSVPAVRKDGYRISVQFSILPIAGPDGRLQGIADIMRDVTADFEARNNKTLQRELNAVRRTSGAA